MVPIAPFIFTWSFLQNSLICVSAPASGYAKYSTIIKSPGKESGFMKKIISFAIGALLLINTAICAEMKDISATEVTKLMGTGWNLGNSLDATDGSGVDSERSWGMPKTTKQMIDTIAAAGFKTIRMPVSWANHMDSSYKVDSDWMARVKTVVDWAIEDDMYVVINCHHDTFFDENGLKAGEGYYPTDKYYKISEKFMSKLWTQISETFKDYDEHLLFETMNEPRLRGTDLEWTFKKDDKNIQKAVKNINKLNQTALKAIRATGGNNAKRFVIVPGYCATPAAVLDSSFVLPSDTAAEKLIVSVHMYTPYTFAGEAPGATKFLPRMQSEFASTFKQLNTKFVSKGVGVFIGEYGAINKNNTEERVKWFQAYIKFSQQNNLVAVLWDNGNWRVPNGSKDYAEKYGYFDRFSCTWYFPEIVDAIMSEMPKPVAEEPVAEPAVQ